MAGMNYKEKFIYSIQMTVMNFYWYILRLINVLINGTQCFENENASFDHISKFEKPWFGNPSKPIIMSSQLLSLLLYPLHKIPGDA